MSISPKSSSPKPSPLKSVKRLSQLTLNLGRAAKRNPRMFGRRLESLVKELGVITPYTAPTKPVAHKPAPKTKIAKTSIAAKSKSTPHDDAAQSLKLNSSFYDIMPLCAPLSIQIDPELAKTPTLNVLIPGMKMEAMSGGPNTALSLTYRLAKHGIPVRYLSVNAPPDSDHGPVFQHIMNLAGHDEKLEWVSIVDADNRAVPISLGENDIFFATAWWTAQMVKQALPLFDVKKFIYLIQDFEPGLHDFSSYYALAMDSYGLDFLPLVNHPILAEHYIRDKIGNFENPEFAERTTVIDPAIDRTLFHMIPKSKTAKKRLLFYARPTVAKRNMFELGVIALKIAVANDIFKGQEWEFIGMGEAFHPIPLGDGHVLECAPWKGMEGYAQQMRETDVLLSLMYAPHPSYPPLEMAACGGITVTNTFGVKTTDRMQKVSENILACEPTPEIIAKTIRVAVETSNNHKARKIGAESFKAPKNWDESFADAEISALNFWNQHVNQS